MTTVPMMHNMKQIRESASIRIKRYQKKCQQILTANTNQTGKQKGAK